MPHSLKVVTSVSDLVIYVSLKHSIGIVGYDTEVFLPIGVAPKEGEDPHCDDDDDDERPSIYDTILMSGEYDQETREGSLYNPKDHEYKYHDKCDFVARLAFLDPQGDPRVRGDKMFISDENTAYTLKGKVGKHNYCPGDIQLYSKLLVHYGQEDLSYFVKSVRVLRNPNAKKETDEALVQLDLVMHM